MSKSANVWKHFKLCWWKKGDKDPCLTEPTEITMGKYDKRRLCEKCGIHVLDHPKEGYRHIKLCTKMSAEEKAEVINSS
jgi:hypothetical protein